MTSPRAMFGARADTRRSRGFPGLTSARQDAPRKTSSRGDGNKKIDCFYIFNK
jgi:hypothetical protein